jgi:hypothetical protein
MRQDALPNAPLPAPRSGPVALADLCEAERRTRRQDRLISHGYVRAALHEAVR